MFKRHDAVLQALQSGFGKGRVLVVGDLMLDCYLWGEVARISPEAPVPVVRVVRRSEVAGGAANVAANLAHLGLHVSLAGVVGTDAARDSLLKLLQDRGVETGAVMAVPERPTITKTRIIGGHQQMMRLDEEEANDLDEAQVEALIAGVRPRIQDADAVVLSDYAKGSLSLSCCQAVIQEASAASVPVLVDPKGHDYAKYAGATAITPNLKELSVATGVPLRDRDRLLASALHMRETIGIEAWVITQGEQGMSLVDAGGIRHFPAVAREVYDVSGAGDTVIATVAAGLVAGLDWEDALRLANVAAGVVVGKVGTVPVEQTDLLKAVQMKQLSEQVNKICEREVLLNRVAEWRTRGERIVFTNGCFDIMHAGHVTYLEQARQEGHRLVVGLNSDRSVRALKGHARPIVAQADRARVLASLAAVDAVVLFDEETPLNLIKAVRPDVLVKGNDYAEEEVVGAREVKSWQGKVVLIPLAEGRSTTDIVSRIRALV